MSESISLKQKLSQARLYAILDLGFVSPKEITPVAEKLVAGGVDLIQLRAKNQSPGEVLAMAKELRSVITPVQKAGPIFIVNDHPEIAAESGADGVHVGQGDYSVAEARKPFGGREGIVGKSTHSLEQALAAEAELADYIGVGPIFATATKPDYVPVGLELIEKVAAQVRVPFFCIGGIKLGNVASVLASGSRRVVIVSGILQSAEIPQYCREVKTVLEKFALPTASL